MFTFISSLLLKLVYLVRDWLDPAAKQRAADYDKGKAAFEEGLKAKKESAEQISKAQEKLDEKSESISNQLEKNSQSIANTERKIEDEQTSLSKKLDKIRIADDDDVLRSDF